MIRALLPLAAWSLIVAGAASVGFLAATRAQPAAAAVMVAPICGVDPHPQRSHVL